jgi:hypothetical protein
MSMYQFSARAIIDDLNIWAFNRRVNNEHVQSICDDLLKQQHPHLIGTIKAVFDAESDEMRVIDGQHRIEALQKYFDINRIRDVNVILEVYYVDDINSPDVYMLYKKANANLNVSVDDDVNVHLSDIVNALSNDPRLSKGIVDKNDGRVNRPRISKKQLFEAFKEHMRVQDMKLSIDDVVGRVVFINKQLKEKISEQQRRIQKAKAENYDFYLNMTEKALDKWIPTIGTIHVKR